jgi:AcrR family transcriptional regulator
MELIRQDVLKWAKANGRYDRFTDPLLLNRKRAEPAARRRHILACAVELAAEGHYRDVTRDQIAARAGISPGLITRCFTTMPQLRRDIVRAAIRDEVLPVIAQAIAHGDKRAAKLSPEVKQKALSSFVS